MRKLRTVLFGSTRRKVAVGLVSSLVIVASASAAWLISVNGQSGRGGIASVSNPTVSYPATDPANDCFPGAVCSVTADVSNPNVYALELVSADFTAGTPSVTKPVGVNNPGCSGATYVVGNTLTGLSIAIPPGSSTIEIPGAYNLSASAPLACAGSFVQFGTSQNIPYTFSTP